MKIRKMEWDDLPMISSLCNELGYPSELEQLQSRFELISQSELHGLFVALNEKKQIVGWAHVATNLALTDDTRCEITGLVVTQSERRKGIGRALVQHCEVWGNEQGFDLIRVRSQALREEAQDFYQSLNYDLKKIQNVFVKKLASDRSN